MQTPGLMTEVAVPHVLLLGSSSAGMCIGDEVKNQSPCSLIGFLRSRAPWQLLKVPVLLVLCQWKPVRDGSYMLNTS